MEVRFEGYENRGDSHKPISRRKESNMRLYLSRLLRESDSLEDMMRYDKCGDMEFPIKIRQGCTCEPATLVWYQLRKAFATRNVSEFNRIRAQIFKSIVDLGENVL